MKFFIRRGFFFCRRSFFGRNLSRFILTFCNLWTAGANKKWTIICSGMATLLLLVLLSFEGGEHGQTCKVEKCFGHPLPLLLLPGFFSRNWIVERMKGSGRSHTLTFLASSHYHKLSFASGRRYLLRAFPGWHPVADSKWHFPVWGLGVRWRWKDKTGNENDYNQH